MVRVIVTPNAATAPQHAAWAELVPTMSEKAFTGHVIRAARELGWLAYHTHDSRHSEAGFPDVCLVRRDQLLFLELKREGRDLTEAQRLWCDALEMAGAAVYRPVRPSDYDTLLEILQPAPPQPAEDGGRVS